MIDLGDYGHPPSTRRRDYPLVQLQIALVWQLNFVLRNFWHRELRELQGRLLDGLKLPRNSSLRQLCLQRRMDQSPLSPRAH